MGSNPKWQAFNANETEVIADGDSFDEVAEKVDELGVEDAVLKPVLEDDTAYLL